MICIRIMKPSDLPRIPEIDRSEKVSQAYVCRDGTLGMIEVQWSVPRWAAEAQGNHAFAGKIEARRPWLEQGGTMFGGFEDRAVVGCAICRPGLSPGVAHFALLRVSRRFRRRGIGRVLAAGVIASARSDAARQLYVSSAPTRGTVDFYRSLGLRPTREANAELLELESDDIHMIMDL